MTIPIIHQRRPLTAAIRAFSREVGGRDGVKLGDQVLVTAEGVKVLVPYPWCDALLA